MLVTLALGITLAPQVRGADIPMFSVHEVTLKSEGNYTNPYKELTAAATLTEPDGKTTRALPLFWSRNFLLFCQDAWCFFVSLSLSGIC